MTRRRRRSVARERLPWSFGLLAISVFHVANANGWTRSPRHLGVVLQQSMGLR